MVTEDIPVGPLMSFLPKANYKNFRSNDYAVKILRAVLHQQIDVT
jgi:hypothetical protein